MAFDIASVNVVVLVGRVGKDPKIFVYDEEFKKKAIISIATSELVTFRDRDDRDDEKRTTWHEVVAWGRKASLVQQLVTKGRLISIQGKLRQNLWTAEDGTKRKYVSVQLDTFTILDSDPKKRKDEEDENKDAY